MTKQSRAKRIAELNDKFRKSLVSAGRTYMSAGVNAKGPEFVAKALIKVIAFDDFNTGNDPHGEHDFGSFELDGEKLFWKIDYYDLKGEFGSEDPTDPQEDAARPHHHARRGVLNSPRLPRVLPAAGYPLPIACAVIRLAYHVLTARTILPGDVLMTLSAELSLKSVHAAITAIEVYNKPNFAYREEAFTILMTNAWELLLKAKWLLDHGEAIDSLYEMADAGAAKVAKTNRSGNPLTHQGNRI
jgi:hypothetical protein